MKPAENTLIKMLSMSDAVPPGLAVAARLAGAPFAAEDGDPLGWWLAEWLSADVEPGPLLTESPQLSTNDIRIIMGEITRLKAPHTRADVAVLDAAEQYIRIFNDLEAVDNLLRDTRRAVLIPGQVTVIIPDDVPLPVSGVLSKMHSMILAIGSIAWVLGHANLGPDEELPDAPQRNRAPEAERQQTPPPRAPLATKRQRVENDEEEEEVRPAKKHKAEDDETDDDDTSGRIPVLDLGPSQIPFDASKSVLGNRANGAFQAFIAQAAGAFAAGCQAGMNAMRASGNVGSRTTPADENTKQRALKTLTRRK